VGDVFAVNPRPIDMALDAGYIVVIAPVAITNDAQYLNVNADTAAGEVALVTEADALVFLTDVPGISDGSRSLPTISAGEATALIEQGVISGGMVPKVAACIRAVAPDRMPFIVDGRRPHVVIEALLGEEGVGTLFQPDS
jgi:acetylglutamate kinase